MCTVRISSLVFPAVVEIAQLQVMLMIYHAWPHFECLQKFTHLFQVHLQFILGGLREFGWMNGCPFECFHRAQIYKQNILLQFLLLLFPLMSATEAPAWLFVLWLRYFQCLGRNNGTILLLSLKHIILNSWAWLNKFSPVTSGMLIWKNRSEGCGKLSISWIVNVILLSLLWVKLMHMWLI